ncbi:glycosyltransferase family 2 protein [Microbacterium ulmi]|uniref:Glycosyltransferase family 2 protein n=1 Tax=Microbacterium ulmi TaxID=179095 RepID=A0A7Y2Q0Z5_9MICO|nr:glycosyltransferase family 2 protein [Microbacterium ulmi]NII70352.1 glycosyltransferase involved in cell wall biosynthesis [Microbacterium ulmi]NNH03400.1 glycosyltransferase family 2 protein [Microbacterium ulmi]
MTGDGPRVSIVVPAYNEGDAIAPFLERVTKTVTIPFELLVVVDTADDTTLPVVADVTASDPRIRGVINTHGRGPAQAIRYGFDVAAAPTVVVTMADGSDDPRQIDSLTELVERGVVVAAGSRYMAGGQQIGGPRFKRLLSRLAGKSLHLFASIGTRDATNSFKAYNADFVRAVTIQSRDGFEIGLELTAKARRARQPVAELPTIWLDRTDGQSNFQLRKWIPKYLRWYFFAFGRPLPINEIKEAAESGSKGNS